MKYVKSKIIKVDTKEAIVGGLCFNVERYNTYLSSEAHYFNTGGEFDWQPCELYFLSDEQIQEGDWFSYNEDVDMIDQYFKKNTVISKHCKKIIATTDESLIIEHHFIDSFGKKRFRGINLPKPSNEFLKKYCELGGIDECWVGYEDKGEWIDNSDYGTELVWNQKLQLKVDTDNTITVKSKLNTIEELQEDILHLCAWYQGRDVDRMKRVEKWAKENLIDLTYSITH